MEKNYEPCDSNNPLDGFRRGEAQIFVNYSKEAKQFAVQLEDVSGRVLQLVASADGQSVLDVMTDSSNRLSTQMEPFSGIMLSFRCIYN